MVHYFENKHESDFYSFIQENSLEKKFKDEISFYYERIFWNDYGKSKIKHAQNLGRLRKVNSKSSQILLKSLDSYQRLQEKIAKFNKVKIEIKKKNPNPNDFIAKLGKRMNRLKSINEEANKIFEFGHGQVSVLVFDALTRVSKNLAAEVLSYEMPIPDKIFQKQFKAEMNKIASSMDQESEGFKRKSQDLIEKYELLITKREDSHLGHEVLEISDIRPKASEMAITFGLGK